MADDAQIGTLQDEIDFQPANATAKPQRPAAPASADEIDFQPAQKPASNLRTPTIGELTAGRPAGAQTPSLTERAARVGQPSPDVSSFAPKSFDLTSVPRSPFTGDIETGPPMRTEEEKQRSGVVAPREQTFSERALRAVGAGAPEGSVMANLTGQRGTKDNPRLFAPEQLMTEAEQQRHPVLTGAGEFAGSMTSPENLMLIGLTGGAGELAGPGAAVAKRLLSAGFSIPMLVNAARMTPQIADAFRRGDTATGERLLTQAVLTAGTAGLAGRGMFEEAAPVTVARGTVGGPLAMDRATSRAGQRMGDFYANAVARAGMGNLAESERGIEAAKQARINAPVEIPPTRSEPTILQGRPQGPEPNPLQTEAARVREEQAGKQPDFRVTDLRRVTPENPEEPPYYELAPREQPSSKRAVEPPPAGETVGARGRSAAMTDLAARAMPKIEGSLQRRFGPDVLDEARQELNAAAGLASSFERPGRYFAAVGQTDEPFITEDPKAGIRHGGSWYGVTSARPMIEDMHPWFKDVAEGPETAARIISEGKGAAYDRMLESAATHIQNERESARPVIEEVFSATPLPGRAGARYRPGFGGDARIARRGQGSWF